MKGKVARNITGRDITQLLAVSGVPEDKMSFLFRTRFGDVQVKYGYIVAGESKAIAHLIFTLRRPGVKIDIEAMKKQEKGFINSLKALFKKK